MKKVLVVVALVISLAVASSVYSQNWPEMTVPPDDFAKDQRFKFSGEIQSVDQKSLTAVVRIGDQVYVGNFEFTRFEGGYSNLSQLKVGDRVTGEGVIVEGLNWIERIKKAPSDAAPWQVRITDYRV